LSGRPLKIKTIEKVREFYQEIQARGGKVKVIGCGGVMEGRDVVDYIRAGASAVQVYTGVVYRGVGGIGEIRREIERELQGQRVSELIGTSVSEL